MPVYIITTLGLLLLFGGLVVVLVALRFLTVDGVAQRLSEYVDQEVEIAPMEAMDDVVRSQELAGSLVSRTVLPLFARVGRILGSLTPGGVLDNLSRKLAVAGNPLGLGAREFYGLRILFNILGLAIVYAVLQQGINQLNLLLAPVLFLIAGYLPKIWLNGRVRARQNQVKKGLPDALDMLSVLANAGLGFDQSLQRVSEYWKTAVGEEFGRVVAEMEMGLSRKEALRNMAERLDVSELSSFIAIILQSDELGMSISDTLHAQSNQMRIERRARAQEEARKIPLKMLFPMIFFIFPALFAVILGPIVPEIAGFFDLMATTVR